MEIELTPMCNLENCPNWKECVKMINLCRENGAWYNCINLSYFRDNFRGN